MKKPLGLSGKRLAGAGLVAFGLLFSSLAFAAISSGDFKTASSVQVTTTELPRALLNFMERRCRE